MPIFGPLLSSGLGQLGCQKCWYMGSSSSGQSGLSLLVSETGNGSSPGHPGPCGEGREGWCGGPQGCQKDPSRQPSPPGTTFSHTPRGLQLPPGRLQECGPDSAMLRAGSAAELSNCPLSAQEHSEWGALPQQGPQTPPVSRPQYLTAGLHLSSHCHSPPTPNPDSPCSA